ncbi:MAG: ShlB/FhaC/HecB family hemolysin secretion/activation protein [Spirulinaceae cyanobacterium]
MFWTLWPWDWCFCRRDFYRGMGGAIASATIAIACGLQTSLAQVPTAPEDRFIQPHTAPPEPLSPEDSTLETPTPPATTPPLTPEAGAIAVDTIEVMGSTVYPDEAWDNLIEPYQNRSVSQDSLEDLADAITQRYLEADYITSRAVLIPESLDTGQIQIQVLEGKIERIEVEAPPNLQEYIRRRAALGTHTPVNANTLEAQLRLLRTDPLLTNLEATLRQGETPLGSILLIRAEAAKPVTGLVSVDNYSPPSVGSERLTLQGSYRNLSGIGDVFTASYKTTLQGGSQTLEFLYRAPLNPMNGTLQLRTSLNWNNVIQPDFRVFDIGGSSQLYEISFRQPLIRTPQEEFALFVGYAYQTGQTFTFAGPTPFGFGPDADGVSTTSTIQLGQEYIWRDVTGAWALRSQFNIGTGWLGATENTEPIPDSHFFSWLGQIQRVQVFNADYFAIASLDLQLATDGLLPSQQFTIGGGQSVRGFRQNVRAADNGLRFSVENRLIVQRDEAGRPVFVFAPFFDLGLVWNAKGNPNLLADQNLIAGIGAGLVWQPLQNLSIRLDYGYPLIELRDRGTNAQDDGFYFSVGYQF